MSKDTIFEIVDDLPKSSITVHALKALDFVVPGEWENVVGFDETIRVVSGETDEKWVQKIGERAIKLYNDRSQGYQRAVWIYQTIDFTDKALATAALADKVGEKINFLSFLSKLTPKADNAQVMDLSLKVVGEAVAFCYVNGLPGDKVSEFARSLADYSGESLMRMAALVCFDGIVPLGTDFMDSTIATLDKMNPSELEKNDLFQKIGSLIPGDGITEQFGFVQHSVSLVRDWANSFVSSNNLSVDKITGSLKNFIEITDDKMDYLGAFLDITTNYFEHTGIQTVARRLIQRAVSEI